MTQYCIVPWNKLLINVHKIHMKPINIVWHHHALQVRNLIVLNVNKSECCTLLSNKRVVCGHHIVSSNIINIIIMPVIDLRSDTITRCSSIKMMIVKTLYLDLMMVWEQPWQQLRLVMMCSEMIPLCWSWRGGWQSSQVRSPVHFETWGWHSKNQILLRRSLILLENNQVFVLESRNMQRSGQKRVQKFSKSMYEYYIIKGIFLFLCLHLFFYKLHSALGSEHKFVWRSLMKGDCLYDECSTWASPN